jgi:hypothetical protein
VCLEGSFQTTVFAITTVSPLTDDMEEETYATAEDVEADEGDVATSDGDIALESDAESIDLTGEADVEKWRGSQLRASRTAGTNCDRPCPVRLVHLSGW